MDSETISPALFERYLRLLGVEAAPPSFAHLSRLVSAQLMRAPFENVSKLLDRRRGRRSPPDLERYLDGIERHGFGGTCYVNNPRFYGLLQHLGYDVRLCGADMSNPDVHLVTMVALDGREWLVDVGYAAPFCEPLPRDLDREFVIHFGRDRYVLHPQDADGRSRLDLERDGKWIHGYLAKPQPRRLEDFETVIRASYADEAAFMNALVVERFFEGRSLRFHNLKMIESTVDACKVTGLAGRDELAAAVEQHCNIARSLVLEAIDGIELGGDIYT